MPAHRSPFVINRNGASHYVPHRLVYHGFTSEKARARVTQQKDVLGTRQTPSCVWRIFWCQRRLSWVQVLVGEQVQIKSRKYGVESSAYYLLVFIYDPFWFLFYLSPCSPKLFYSLSFSITIYVYFTSPMHTVCPASCILSYFVILIIFGEWYINHEDPHYAIYPILQLLPLW